MKKNLLLLIALLTFSVAVQSQVKPRPNLQQLQHLNINDPSLTIPAISGTQDKCGFAAMMNEARNNGFNDALYEQELRRIILARRQMNSFLPPASIYTVPVIFHISYDGNTESAIGTGANISALQINAQIIQLNKDFANLSGSLYTGIAEDMGVRFVAAKIDPAGNLICEPGIERINWRSRSGWLDPTTLSSITAVSNHYNNIVKPQSIWDPYQYLNIWLGNFTASGLLGFASFPDQSTLAGLNSTETDFNAGVVILSGSVGSLTSPGTATPYQSGRTLTHELGHFFGLRHITGDSNCGDDYCLDTPTQSALTTGCPGVGAANNCFPPGPKMFENYMDYSNDACLNTFTSNQSERCQAVMLNSPRRKELVTSTKGNSPMPNRIFFKPTISSFFETATGTCPRYKDYFITLGVDVAASGNATISLLKTGTATDGADYTIFPASVSYTSGDATDKTFTLRVYDDAIIEGNETIALNFSIAGSGVQTGVGCISQYSLTVRDDDATLDINNIPSITLLTENFGSVGGTNAIPTGWTVSGSTTNTWVGNSFDAALYGFTGNTLHISDGNPGEVSGGVAAINYNINTTSDSRITTPTMNGTGLRNIAVSLKLMSNGESDINGTYDYGIIYYSLDGSNYSACRDINNNFILQGITTATPMTLYVPAATVGTATMKFLFRWISDNNEGSQPPFTIDDVVITGKPTSVESELNHSVTENVPAGTGISHFYSSNDLQIIASVQNSSISVGCLNASVQNQGVGVTAVTTTSGVYQRSQKVISLIPEVANTTASYTATFYFSTAELAAWGGQVSSLKLMKVRTGVNLGGVLSGADAVVVPAVVNDLTATKGYASFTGNFTGGFSQFFLVSPTAAVPVTLLSFDAKAAVKNILLAWATSTEVNNKGFVIERSADGTRFEKIGWSDGKINSTTTTSYTFIDNFVQPGVLYYYRLRQTDLDGRETLSETRQARIKGNDVIVTLSPNPATDILKVFTSGYSGLSQVKLINVKGQVLQHWSNINTSAASQSLDVSNVAAGIYFVQVRTTQDVYTERVIIK